MHVERLQRVVGVATDGERGDHEQHDRERTAHAATVAHRMRSRGTRPLQQLVDQRDGQERRTARNSPTRSARSRRAAPPAGGCPTLNTATTSSVRARIDDGSRRSDTHALPRRGRSRSRSAGRTTRTAAARSRAAGSATTVAAGRRRRAAGSRRGGSTAAGSAGSARRAGGTRGRAPCRATRCPVPPSRGARGTAGRPSRAARRRAGCGARGSMPHTSTMQRERDGDDEVEPEQHRRAEQDARRDREAMRDVVVRRGAAPRCRR